MSAKPKEAISSNMPRVGAHDDRPSEPARDSLRQFRLAIAAMRPRQWTKNGLVVLALIFAHKLSDVGADERVALAVAAFALASSAVYIMNDWVDRDRDRLHPRKRFRPLASGALRPSVAFVTAVLALLGATGLVVWLGLWLARLSDPFAMWGGSPMLFALTLGGYVAVNVVYSLYLKHQPLWDVFIIALGFVLRAVAGALAIPAPISPWFYLCATFLALLLALGKRRAELVALTDGAANHRSNLGAYTIQLLDQLVTIMATCALISYSFYTFQGESASHALMLTIPFALFGVFRYLFLMYTQGAGERPDELLWRDRQIFVCVALWGIVTLVLLYGLPRV